MLRVESSDVSREFQRSEVLTFIGSSDASYCHYNLVTVGAGNGYKMASFSRGALNTPKPPPLDAADSADTHTHTFLSLTNSPNPLLVSD